MRLHVTRKFDLAMQALLELDSATETVKAYRLGEQLDASSTFMAQVMRPLASAGWVESSPGPTGGYRLVADLRELSFLDVLEVVEGPTDDGRCIVRGWCGDNDQYCTLHSAWAAARAAMLGHLAETAVAEAATGEPASAPVGTKGARR